MASADERVSLAHAHAMRYRAQHRKHAIRSHGCRGRRVPTHPPPSDVALTVSSAAHRGGFSMPMYRAIRDGSLIPADLPRPRTSGQRMRSSVRWQRASAAQIARQPWCSVCGATEDLTADHIAPVSEGGAPFGELDTLCRQCNSAKGPR